MQMTFLPKIDREATRAKVEKVLEEYKIYLLMDPEDLQPKITSTFEIVPPTPNNQFHSSTEKTAIDRIDLENERQRFISWVQKCVNRLSRNERAIIVNLYFVEEEPMNYIVYNKLGFSETKYYKIKADAFYKLAFIMKLQVYEEEVEV
ncbi:ArpU family transcriptional regulator [Radiobacillus kanasensis]|uniref:ArpU family phage packaging/lysis transcriptional regulator n=1 Tax=Radiobacillus kanasensis TaxID=2844358 RepID=UPI001E463E28|nr:ArpU family phage packaging/lysis transcriptional regulator [Radiobacillus kanasensis]UFU00356.1 ArpU family transcriptional regulator [Radiobacillus kanasensis]